MPPDRKEEEEERKGEEGKSHFFPSSLLYFSGVRTSLVGRGQQKETRRQIQTMSPPPIPRGL